MCIRYFILYVSGRGISKMHARREILMPVSLIYVNSDAPMDLACDQCGPRASRERREMLHAMDRSLVV